MPLLRACDPHEWDVACIGLRPFADEIGEIKRLYVAPTARGQGLGRVLVERIIEVAREIGYRSLRLDTLPSMKEAQSLYTSLGFAPTAAYRFNPIAGAADRPTRPPDRSTRTSVRHPSSLTFPA